MAGNRGPRGKEGRRSVRDVVERHASNEDFAKITADARGERAIPASSNRSSPPWQELTAPRGGSNPESNRSFESQSTRLRTLAQDAYEILDFKKRNEASAQLATDDAFASIEADSFLAGELKDILPELKRIFHEAALESGSYFRVACSLPEEDRAARKKAGSIAADKSIVVNRAALKKIAKLLSFEPQRGPQLFDHAGFLDIVPIAARASGKNFLSAAFAPTHENPSRSTKATATYVRGRIDNVVADNDHFRTDGSLGRLRITRSIPENDTRSQILLELGLRLANTTWKAQQVHRAVVLGNTGRLEDPDFDTFENMARRAYETAHTDSVKKLKEQSMDEQASEKLARELAETNTIWTLSKDLISNQDVLAAAKSRPAEELPSLDEIEQSLEQEVGYLNALLLDLDHSPKNGTDLDEQKKIHQEEDDITERLAVVQRQLSRIRNERQRAQVPSVSAPWVSGQNPADTAWKKHYTGTEDNQFDPRFTFGPAGELKMLNEERAGLALLLKGTPGRATLERKEKYLTAFIEKRRTSKELTLAIKNKIEAAKKRLEETRRLLSHRMRWEQLNDEEQNLKRLVEGDVLRSSADLTETERLLGVYDEQYPFNEPEGVYAPVEVLPKEPAPGESRELYSARIDWLTTGRALRHQRRELKRQIDLLNGRIRIASQDLNNPRNQLTQTTLELERVPLEKRLADVNRKLWSLIERAKPHEDPMLDRPKKDDLAGFLEQNAPSGTELVKALVEREVSALVPPYRRSHDNGIDTDNFRRVEDVINDLRVHPEAVLEHLQTSLNEARTFYENASSRADSGTLGKIDGALKTIREIDSHDRGDETRGQAPLRMVQVALDAAHQRLLAQKEEVERAKQEERAHKDRIVASFINQSQQRQNEIQKTLDARAQRIWVRITAVGIVLAGALAALVEGHGGRTVTPGEKAKASHEDTRQPNVRRTSPERLVQEKLPAVGVSHQAGFASGVTAAPAVEAPANTAHFPFELESLAPMAMTNHHGVFVDANKPELYIGVDEDGTKRIIAFGIQNEDWPSFIEARRPYLESQGFNAKRVLIYASDGSLNYWTGKGWEAAGDFLYDPAELRESFVAVAGPGSVAMP